MWLNNRYGISSILFDNNNVKMSQWQYKLQFLNVFLEKLHNREFFRSQIDFWLSGFGCIIDENNFYALDHL
jgi:hypothetical protein